MKVHFQNRRNEKIVGILKIPDKKSNEITIIIHGFAANRNGGSAITAKLLENNKFNSFIFDLDNCGESEPKFEESTPSKNVQTILDSINYCKNLGFKKINIIGTSSGGFLAMAVALNYSKINSLILRSTSASDAEWFKKNYGSKKIALWKKDGYYLRQGKLGLKKVGYCYYEDALKYDFYKNAKKIKIPTLVIHGTNDNVVQLKYTKKLLENFPKAQLKVIKGADHSLGVNGDYSESQKAIIDWLKKEKK